MIAGFIVCVLAGFFYLGYRVYPKIKPCPEIASDTVYVYDTIVHVIKDTVPYYIVKWDTTIIKDTVYLDTDTAEIINRWLYTYEVYNRTWEDSLLYVNISDTIHQNTPVGNLFSYKILRPQQIIHNEYSSNLVYNSYLYIGFDLTIPDLKYTEIEAMYAWNNALVGIGYTPNYKIFSLKVAGPVLKFKKIK